MFFFHSVTSRYYINKVTIQSNNNTTSGEINALAITVAKSSSVFFLEAKGLINTLITTACGKLIDGTPSIVDKMLFQPYLITNPDNTKPNGNRTKSIIDFLRN